MEKLEVPEEILDKIKKLMDMKAHAERQSKDHGVYNDQNEIEALSMAINKLLLKYNLSMSMMAGHKGESAKKTAPVGDITYDLNGTMTRHEAGWVVDLFFAISTHNLCKALYRKGRNGKDDMGSIVLIGKSHNIEIVKYLVDQLIERIKDMCSKAFRKYGGPEKRNTFRRGFLRGAVAGLRDKLDQQEAERKREETRMLDDTQLQLQNHQMGMMIFNEQRELTKYMYANFNVKSSGGGKALSGKNGFGQGYEQGSQMGIRSGLNGTGQKQIGN